MPTAAILLTLLGTFAASAALTPLVRHLARRLKLLAHPNLDRWHREPVALLGGYAIAGACAIGILLSAPAGPLAPLLLGAGLMWTLGAVDDAFHFRPATKLVLQSMIAAVVIYLAPRAQITGFPPIDTLIVLVWIVGITNAFNLLDNIDGLSAGIAALAGIFYLAALLPTGASPLMLAMAAFVGAALGFLIYNFKPASIFMGDSGSLFLGSFLGISALLAAPELEGSIVPVAAIPLFILLIPIFDTVFVSITRRLAGRSPMHGGRDHLSHRLVRLGIGERRAVLGLYLLAAIGGAIAVTLQYSDIGYAAILIGLYLILLAAIGIVLGHVEAHAQEESGARPVLVADVAYKNRAYEVLLDLALIALAYYAAFRLRFQGLDFTYFVAAFATSFPLVVACQICGLAMAGKYRQVWRTFGASELVGILKGIAFGVAGSALLMLYLYRFEGFSRLVFLIDAGILAFLVIGARVAITLVDEYLRKQRRGGRPVIIYGAGRGGALLVRELLEDPGLGLMPVGFIDDNPAKRRLRLEGIPVLGTFHQLPALLEERGIAVVLISIRDLDRTRVAEVASLCRERGVEIRSMRFALEEIGPVPHIRHVQGL